MTKLEKLLAELPDTADGIAAYLQQKGIKGLRNSYTRCPLVNWINQAEVTWPGIHGYISADYKSTWFIIDDPQILFPKVEGSPAVLEFSLKFNRGEYPELVLTSN